LFVLEATNEALISTQLIGYISADKAVGKARPLVSNQHPDPADRILSVPSRQSDLFGSLGQTKQSPQTADADAGGQSPKTTY